MKIGVHADRSAGICLAFIMQCPISSNAGIAVGYGNDGTTEHLVPNDKMTRVKRIPLWYPRMPQFAVEVFRKKMKGKGIRKCPDWRSPHSSFCLPRPRKISFRDDFSSFRVSSIFSHLCPVLETKIRSPFGTSVKGDLHGQFSLLWIPERDENG
jgi:hypothetical protein